MCLTPLTLVRVETDKPKMNQAPTKTRVVPCGKCVECLARRRNAWSFRLYQEMQSSLSAFFVTLTYGINEKERFGEEPPMSANGFLTLDKKDLQLFFKRLRKYETGKGNPAKLRYYAVGEYGTKNERPHYHIILFNLSQHTAKRSMDVARNIWKKGNVDIAKCNIATINYTVGYVMQGRWNPSMDTDDRLGNFSVCSKGLGASYLTDTRCAWHTDRLENTVMHPSGFRMPLPRYYSDKIFDKEEKEQINDFLETYRDLSWSDLESMDWNKKIMTTKHKIQEHERRKIETRAKV